MGVKWTCALFCLLGIVSLPVEGIQRQNMRERRDLRNAFESPSMTRKKRDVSHVLQDQGPQNGPNPAAFQNPGSFARSGSSSFASGSASGTFGNSATGFDGVGSYPGYSGAGSGPFYRGGSSFGSAGQPWSQSGSFNGFPGQNSYRPSGYYPNNNVGYNPYYSNQNPAAFFDSPIFDPQAFVQEYFRQLEEQQRQFESQFRGPQQPWGKNTNHARSYAAAIMTGPNGEVNPKARTYSYSWSSIPKRSPAGTKYTGAGNSWQERNADTVNKNAVNNDQRFFGLNNRLGNGPPNFNDQYTPNNFGFGTRGGFNAGSNFPNSANTGQRFPNTGFGGSNTFGKPTVGNGAHAYANIGPNGGTYGAEFTPGTPGILNRFKETVPPPNGQSYATFTSTSKTHSRDSDGNEINEEVATVGVNDNGNITLKTIRNPPIPNN
ncbi:uncharacterized protein LOC105685952 isoform X1 [Athalia rosae]|uniref:uncharacterized protein LOC105685952 isoform X1 n=2 Tax=Athalia rosae TaxID=37344 RepID=UPI0020349C94|nr:uncharacterized protein LOC105685952 isoform X1 [Athalia rosae]